MYCQKLRDDSLAAVHKVPPSLRARGRIMQEREKELLFHGLTHRAIINAAICDANGLKWASLL